MQQKIKKLIYFFTVFSFFKPDYFVGVGSKFNYVYSIFQSILMVIGLLILFINIHNKKTSKIMYLIILYNIIILLSSFINNNGNAFSLIFKSALMISFCSVVEDSIINEDYCIVKYSYFLLYIYSIINIYTMFAYPNGMWVSPLTKYWQMWFLGYDNNHIIILLPLIVFGYIYNMKKHGKLNIYFYFMLFIVNFTVIKSWSATSIVGIMLIDIFIMYSKNINIKNIVKLFKLYVILFFLIILFRFQNIFSYLIVDILKKDLTFSNRTYIWDYIIKFITKKPLLGYGIQNSNIRFNISRSYKSFHAHNIFLETIYRGGIILLIVFLIMIYFVIKKLKEYNNEFSKFFMWVIFVYGVILFTEFFEPVNFVYLLVIFYNISHIRKEDKLNG